MIQKLEQFFLFDPHNSNLFITSLSLLQIFHSVYFFLCLSVCISTSLCKRRYFFSLLLFLTFTIHLGDVSAQLSSRKRRIFLWPLGEFKFLTSSYYGAPLFSYSSWAVSTLSLCWVFKSSSSLSFFLSFFLSDHSRCQRSCCWLSFHFEYFH